MINAWQKLHIKFWKIAIFYTHINADDYTDAFNAGIEPSSGPLGRPLNQCIELARRIIFSYP